MGTERKTNETPSGALIASAAIKDDRAGRYRENTLERPSWTGVLISRG